MPNRLDDYIRKCLKENPYDDGTRALWESHLTRGQKYMAMGMRREAIAEYAKEHNRPIKSASDAEIVQKSYVLTARAYKQLGEIDQAVQAYRRAYDLLKQYKYGSYPHMELAEIYIEQGQFDEAIALLQDEKLGDYRAKDLLARAIELKQKLS